MRFRCLLLCALALSLPASAQTLDKIRKSGTVTLGYIDGAAPFSYTDGNGQPQGYSVELCSAVAEGVGAQLKRKGLKVRWVNPSAAPTRSHPATPDRPPACAGRPWRRGRARAHGSAASRPP